MTDASRPSMSRDGMHDDTAHADARVPLTLEGTREVPDKTRACKWRAERRDTFGARVFLDAFTEASFLLQSS